MIEYVDVAPTLTDLAKGTIPDNLDGKSFKAVLQGKASAHKDFVYGIQTSMNIHEGAPYPIRSVRSEKYKLIHNLMHDGNFSNIVTNNSWFKKELQREKILKKNNYAKYIKRPEYEFYDIANDPFEQTNLIGRAKYNKELTVLKNKLTAWMEQQGDLGIAIELSVCERKGFNHRGCNGSP